MRYEAVIGLEIHAQLLTSTKIFCGCPTTFGAEPNTQVCPTCLGLPGAMPALNRQVVAFATRAALALQCRVHERSVFARKHYFYPDTPKGYQISQYDQPLATRGWIAFSADPGAARVAITRLHLEEDAGKSLHHGFPDSDRTTYLDFNRSGVPLIEIVTEPDLRSAADAAACFMRIRDVLVAIGVNDGNMEEGSLRCDANISVRPIGHEAFGVKTEVKNVNSFRYVQKAIEFEVARQMAILEGGGAVRHETRLWDSDTGRTESMRSKEDAHDYRYFPEPDLPPLVVNQAWIDSIQASMPELSEARRARLRAAYDLTEYDAEIIGRHSLSAAYFEAMVRAGASPKSAVNWLQGEVRRKLKEIGRDDDMTAMALSQSALAELATLAESGVISSTVAKEVFEKMWTTGQSAKAIVDADGLSQIGDEAALQALVADVLAANPGPVADFRAGKKNAFGFLVGQAMKASAGKANPKLINELVRKALA